MIKQENSRKIRRATCQADNVLDKMQYGKIGYSEHFYDIQADYWSSFNLNPLNYLDDDVKLRELLETTARSYKVRI